MENKMSTKLNWVRFLCAVIIVTDHSFDYIRYGEINKGVVENLIYFFTQMSTKGLTWIAMALFFTISGYLMFHNWNNKIDTITWYKSKLKSRIRTLLVPYLCWNSIWTVFYIVAGKILTDTNIDTSYTISNIADGVLYGKFNEIFWYIQVLMIFAVISPMIGMCVERLKIAWVMIAAIISFAVMMLLVSGPFVMMRNYYCFFFYSLGAYLTMNRQEIVTTRVSEKSKALLLSELVLSIFVIQLTKTPDNIFSPVQGGIMLVATFFGIICAWLIADPPGIITKSNWGGGCAPAHL